MEDKIKELKKLENDLEKLKKSNHDMWMTYGSELCAGSMIKEEEILEKKINTLKKELN